MTLEDLLPRSCQPARDLNFSQMNTIHIVIYIISWRYILISHLRHGLPSDLTLQIFTLKCYSTFLIISMCATRSAHILLEFTSSIWAGAQLWRCAYTPCSEPCSPKATNCDFLYFSCCLYLHYFLRMNITNVMTEWLALLFRIREVPGSIIGPKTAYDFLSPPGKCQVSKLDRCCFFSMAFKTHYPVVCDFWGPHG
jgi:hypothetical protein